MRVSSRTASGRPRRSLVALPLLAAPLLLLAACGGGEEGEARANATLLKAVMGAPALGEYTIALEPASVAAGPVRFAIENAGELEHEFEVIKTELAPDQFPVVDGRAEVEANGGEEVDEVEDLRAGDRAELTLELEPGNYVIVCNLPGHYEQGMVTAFAVSPAGAEAQ